MSNTKNKSKGENRTKKTPEYDESAPMLVKKSAVVDIHHRPDADEPTVPACSASYRYDGLEWEPLDAHQETRLCNNCAGARTGGGNGLHQRRELLEADPEDYGLEPMPEPDASNPQ